MSSGGGGGGPKSVEEDMVGKFSGGSVTCIMARIRQREVMRVRAGSGDRVGFASRPLLDM